jgi:hypothetical protein
MHEGNGLVPMPLSSESTAPDLRQEPFSFLHLGKDIIKWDLVAQKKRLEQVMADYRELAAEWPR